MKLKHWSNENHCNDKIEIEDDNALINLFATLINNRIEISFLGFIGSNQICKDAMKTLQIVTYEKFLPHIIDITEAANPGNNRYISCSAKGNLGYSLPQSIVCRSMPHAFQLDKAARADIEWCDALFLHPLNRKTSAAVTALRPESVAVWCGMGGDYYDYSSEFCKQLHLSHTDKAIQRLRPKAGSSGKITGWLAENTGTSLRKFRDQVRKVASDIDFFCVLEKDIRLDFLPDFRAENLGEFSYYTYENSFSPGSEPVEGDDILIGNSAHSTNNHFDIFEQLRNVDLGARQIVLPLSYGPADYADEIERYAKSVFGDDHVISLRKWMPISEYNKVLTRCGTVIMNHNRGQAMGNICSMVMRGARVYLRPKNPYAEFLESLGVAFGYIGEGNLDASILEKLTPAEKSSNKQIMIDHWNRAAVVNRTEALFQKVDGKLDN